MTESHEFRRMSDNLLERVLNQQEKILNKLGDFEREHGERVARLEERVDAVVRTSEALEKIVRSHETWINTSNGKTSVIGAVFGVLGSLITFIVDHFVLRGR